MADSSERRQRRPGAIAAEGRTTVSSHVSVEGTLGWTRPENRSDSAEVGARQRKSVEHRVSAGDSLCWRVSIDAFDIGVRATFAAGGGYKANADEHVQLLADTRVGGNDTSSTSDTLEEAFIAQNDGIFTLTLDNSYSKLRGKRVRWRITEQRYAVLDTRCVLTIYSARGGRLLEQLPLVDAVAQPVKSADFRPVTFELTLDRKERHYFQPSSKAAQADWLSSLSIASQLDTMQRHTAATLIQRVVRRMLAVIRFRRLRRYAVDRASLQKAIQEQLLPPSALAKHRPGGAPDGASAMANGERWQMVSDCDSVTEVVMQHEHWGLRGFRGAFLSRVPKAIRVPAWCNADGVELAHLTASQAEALSAADDRLPNGWKWVDDAWTLDRTGSKDPDGWQYARGLPVLLGWQSEGFVGNLVRRRKWIRVRNKIKVRPGAHGANSVPLNSVFVTSRKCSFIGKFTSVSGVVLNIWRPTVPASHRILGDCISAGEDPPSSFVSVDMERVANSRPMFMRHWVQNVVQFTMVWNNGRVWAWRPNPPSVPPQLLKKKRLQPLGWVFTTTAAPPDVENVAVVSEAFLDSVSPTVLGQPEEVDEPSAVDPTGVEQPRLLTASNEACSRSEFVQVSVGFTRSSTESASSGNNDYGASDCKFLVDRTTNLVFLSRLCSKEQDTTQDFYHDHDGLPSLFRLKKQVAPAEQMDSIARSSRYAPHLHLLMQAEPPQACSDPIVCFTLLSSRYYTGSRIEMVTASGNVLRVWDLSKGECTRELSFHLDPVTCITAAGQLVFSGSGKVLIGSDMVAGCQIPGAYFRHASFVTCTDARRINLSDSSTVVAVVSGTDIVGKRVRLWVSSEFRGLSNELSFTRIGMPSIGIHAGAVSSCKIWDAKNDVDGTLAIPSAFHFVRIAVYRSNDARAITLSNLCLMDIRGLTIPPSRAVDLTSGTPVEIDISEADGETGLNWTIRAAAGIARQSSTCSFGRCLLAVLEVEFERSVVLETVAWEMSDDQPPLRWSLFGSANWRQWYPLTESTEARQIEPILRRGENAGNTRDASNDGSDAGNGSVQKKATRLAMFGPYPVLPWGDCTPMSAPHAAGDFYRIPLILSTCHTTLCIWSVCEDVQSSTHKGVCVAKIKAGNAPLDLSSRAAGSWHEEAHQGELTCCTVMHDSRVVTGSQDGTLKVWHPATNRCEATLHAESRVISCEAVTLRGSAHLNAERLALRFDQQYWHNRTFTMRHLTQLDQSPGGQKFVSGVGESPALVEPGEMPFATLSWWMVPGTDGKVKIHCERDGKMCSLGVVADKVAVIEGGGCDWQLKFDARAIVRTHKRHQGGRKAGGGNGSQDVVSWPLYSVVQPMNIYRSANSEQPPIELAVGDTLQLLGTHALFQSSVWQHVFVVREGSNCDISGWLRLDGVELNSCLVPFKQNSTVVQICTPSGDKALAAKASNGQLFLESYAEIRDSGWWRIEEATAVQMVSASFEDGSTKFWTQDFRDGPWMHNTEASKVIRHSCPSKSFAIIPTDLTEGVPASMLAITCNTNTTEDPTSSVEQSVAIWRLDESQESSSRFDAALQIRLWTPFVTHNICCLHPLVVEDYVAGMIKYVDMGSGDGYERTFADPSTTSLTTTDLLRTKVQFEGLFFQLMSHIRLTPAVSSVSRRSTNRELEPGNAFCNRSKENSADYLYWISHASTDTGYSATFVEDERLTWYTCKVGSVIRDANIPADQLGGIYVVEAVVPAATSSFARLDERQKPDIERTITVRKINPDNSLSYDIETGRDPADFVAPGFWEGYQPPEQFPMLIFMLFPFIPYSLVPAISKMAGQLCSSMSTLACWGRSGMKRQGLKRRVSVHTVAPSQDQQRELEWQELLASARLGSPVQACVVPLPDAAGPYLSSHISYSRLLPSWSDDVGDDSAMELSLLHACVEYSSARPEDQHELFSMEVPEVIVQFKWMAFGSKHVYTALRAYLWLVVTFSAFAVRMVKTGPFGEVGTVIIDHCLVLFALCLTLWFVLNEVWSLAAQGWTQYLRDRWNWVDWACYALVLYCLLAGYSFSLSSSWSTPGSPQLALAELMLWGKVLYFLRAFEATGVYILTMVHIMHDIREFILIIALFILGFGFAFFVLFNESDAFNGEDVKYAYQNLAYALLSTFNMGVMGDFSMDMFHNQEHEVLLLGLFVTNVAIITVIMLNMLIALMSSTYERATEHSAAASKYQRAEILLDIESTMSTRQRRDPAYFPRYLHVLKEKPSASQSISYRTGDTELQQHDPIPGHSSSSLRSIPGNASVDNLLAKMYDKQEEQATEIRRIGEMLEKLCTATPTEM